MTLPHTAPSSDPSENLVHTPPAYIASEVLRAFDAGAGDLVFVARSDRMAEQVMEAVSAYRPDGPLLFLPAWDCLPYDRVAPSPAVMGERMEAIRMWLNRSRAPTLLITSLEATLQRIPPPEIIAKARFTFEKNAVFDLDAFRSFITSHGYGGDGLVDEPGEAAIRKDVIDIFPPSTSKPVRIYLDAEGRIADLKAYDPVTQRTDESIETLVIGPASELVGTPGTDESATETRQTTMERRMFALYGDLATLFDVIGDTPICLAHDVKGRVASYLDIIEEARSARKDGTETGRASLYLDEAEWTAAMEKAGTCELQFEGAEPLPRFFGKPRAQRLFTDFADDAVAHGKTLVVCGDERAEAIANRLGQTLKRSVEPIADWQMLKSIGSSKIYTAPFPLRQGFTDRARDLMIVSVEEILGPPAGEAKTRAFRLAEPELRIGDVVVHEGHGVGVLRALETTDIDGVERDAVRLDYHGGASVLVPMEEFGRLWRYGSEPEAVTLDRLHTEAWAKKRASVEKDIVKAARHLVKLAAARRKLEAPVIEPPRARYAAFAARFPYLLTPDQDAAIRDVLADLASVTPMNRLVVGDVGYGKTELALRAAAATALAGYQVVVLAPTTVLARQHALTFERRFAGTGVEVALLSRALSAAEARDVKARLADGSLSIVVATHAVLADDVEFQKLALLVVDEEHRFGAKDKEAMRALSPSLHVLTMSATPIPRTLQSALVGIQEISLLTTPPARRRPVRTSLVEYDPPSIRTALLRERRRGGQSFFVVPRIEDIAALEKLLAEHVPELTVLTAHGKMPAAEMDDCVLRFAEGEGDILLSTNIIESGLDIPNANTIFVWRADRFGLSQLHQLRGRVGRGRAQGIATFLTAPGEDVSEETRKRLATMVELDRLGSGIDIAMRDLDLRGAGDLVGEDQAGHLKVIGVSLYQKLLANAVAAIGGQRRETLTPTLSLGYPGHIPPAFVPDALVRLNLYSRLMRLADVDAADDLEDEIRDRFGDLPEPLLRLLALARLRIAAADLGIREIAAGPKAIAVTFADKPSKARLAKWKNLPEPAIKDGRYVFPIATETEDDRLAIVWKITGHGTRRALMGH